MWKFALGDRIHEVRTETMKVKHIEKTTRQFKWILFIVVSIFASCYFYLPFGGLTLMIGWMLVMVLIVVKIVLR